MGCRSWCVKRTPAPLSRRRSPLPRRERVLPRDAAGRDPAARYSADADVLHVVVVCPRAPELVLSLVLGDPDDELARLRLRVAELVVAGALALERHPRAVRAKPREGAGREARVGARDDCLPPLRPLDPLA